MLELPLLLEADQRERQLGNDALSIVDLCKPEAHQQHPIPGAGLLDYPKSVRVARPVVGLLPPDTLRAMLEGRGVATEKQVVVYCGCHHRPTHTFILLKWLGC